MADEYKRYQVIHDMGSGLLIVKVQLDSLVEQNVNARIMKDQMQDQLTANIQKRGQLESLPLVALIDGKLKIISGHHRIKSARAAGLKEIYCLLDVSGLSKSQEAAKQLAHNAISGFDDQSTLREIAKMISDVDDMLESFVGKDSGRAVCGVRQASFLRCSLISRRSRSPSCRISSKTLSCW